MLVKGRVMARFGTFTYEHDDVIKWKHFRVTGHLCGDSPYKGQWRGAFIFSLICVWINGLVNNREAGDLRLSRPLWRQRNGPALDVLLAWISGVWSRISNYRYSMDANTRRYQSDWCWSIFVCENVDQLPQTKSHTLCVISILHQKLTFHSLIW